MKPVKNLNISLFTSEWFDEAYQSFINHPYYQKDDNVVLWWEFDEDKIPKGLTFSQQKEFVDDPENFTLLNQVELVPFWEYLCFFYSSPDKRYGSVYIGLLLENLSNHFHYTSELLGVVYIMTKIKGEIHSVCSHLNMFFSSRIPKYESQFKSIFAYFESSLLSEYLDKITKLSPIHTSSVITTSIIDKLNTLCDIDLGFKNTLRQSFRKENKDADPAKTLMSFLLKEPNALWRSGYFKIYTTPGKLYEFLSTLAIIGRPKWNEVGEYFMLKSKKVTYEAYRAGKSRAKGKLNEAAYSVLHE